jgi:rSAM/selenodomain-associated transferase 2
MVSVVIPTYNEADGIVPTLEHLSRARGTFEVIIVDGESTDGTPASVETLVPAFPRPLRLLRAERNRARQLNRAVAAAGGGALLFLHADALLAPEAIESLEAALRDDAVVGGNFDVAFEGHSGWNRFFTWANRLRRRFGIYYGDSALFVRREVFERLGGFKSIPIMDDYEFVRRLERAGRTVCLSPRVRVSDRRWRVQGVFRTLWSWVVVQVLYSLGVPPQLLAHCYPPVRAEQESRKEPARFDERNEARGASQEMP